MKAEERLAEAKGTALRDERPIDLYDLAREAIGLLRDFPVNYAAPGFADVSRAELAKWVARMERFLDGEGEEK